MKFEKKNDFYESDLSKDLDIFEFTKEFKNLDLTRATLKITNVANTLPKMELIMNFSQKAEIATIPIWSIKDSYQWPDSDILEIIVEESNIYINFVLCKENTVIFTNNDIERYLTFMTKVNKDISKIRGWAIKNKMKEIYSTLKESKEVKSIIDTISQKNNQEKEKENKTNIKLNLKEIDMSVFDKITNYSEMPKEDRMKIASRLIFRPIWSHEEYRAVINYMRIKHPEMTRGDHKIQWRYKQYPKEVSVVDRPTGIESKMAATICYDSLTMEPVGFSGVYYRPSSQYGVIQNGIVMFVDPNYRRMGIAQTFYTIQEEKLRRCGVRYCYEIQIGGNIQLSDKNGYIMLSKGRLCKDGTYSQVRYLIDSEDQKSIDRWNNLKCNPIDWESGLETTFLNNNYKLGDGKPFTIAGLNSPWADQ